MRGLIRLAVLLLLACAAAPALAERVALEQAVGRLGTAARGTAAALFFHAGQPIEDERRRREGMRAIVPAAPGRSSNVLDSVPVGGGSPTLRDTWQVLRRETLELESGPRAMLVMRRERRGELGNGHLSHET